MYGLIFLLILAVIITIVVWNHLEGNIPCTLSKYVEYNLYTKEKKPRNPTEPIDLVYTWIDGNDPKRIKDINKYKPEILLQEGGSSNRWRDNDELKYSIRSARKYAPWIRNIYVVTSYGQRPKWLSNNSDIKIINDTEIVPSQYLPTFNSLVIEAFIHKIPGLSNRYLYLCDDFFFGNNAYYSDFVCKDGRRKVFLADYEYRGSIKKHDASFIAGIKYTNSLLNSYTRRNSPRAISLHVPQIHSKEEDQEKLSTFKEAYHITCSSKFRDVYNVHDNTLLDPWWGMYHGTAKLKHIPHIFIGVTNNYSMNRAKFRRLTKIRPKTFCLNDDVLEDLSVVEQVPEFLQLYFPDKGPDER